MKSRCLSTTQAVTLHAFQPLTQSHTRLSWLYKTLCTAILNNNQAFDLEEDSSVDRKIWQVYCLWKKKSLKVWLEESRKSFRRRGRWRSFHVKRPETEKAREPIAENLVGRIWSLRSGAESMGRCVKLQTRSHRDQTVSARDAFIAVFYFTCLLNH